MNNKSLKNKISKNKKIIKHVAIIMDGNGRWANNKGKSRLYGHRAGIKSAMKIINASIYYKIKVLTLYAFSSENWKRPKKEVLFLMKLFIYILKNKTNELNKKNIKLKIIGEKKKLNEELIYFINKSENITNKNTGLILNIAINYGGKWDILKCFKKIFNKIKNKLITEKDINESLIENNISLRNCPKVDLVIRTGGELRISNFLLWQIAYSELYFTNILWPDFDKNTFKEALISFYNRNRRFGKIK